MRFDRRTLVVGGIAVIAPWSLVAQSFPNRSVNIVVPFAPGGPTDFIARLLVDPLGKQFGQSVVIENRPGAAGNLGAAAVAHGEANGYTLLHSTVAMLAVNPILYPQAPFDPLRDLTTIGTTAALPNVLVVNPQITDVASVSELVAYAKRKPGGLSFGTFGSGSSSHILGSLFQKLAGIQAVPIPFRGSAPALTEIIGGRIDYLFDSVTTSAEQIQAGNVRALAITAPRRLAHLPDVPTMQEAGYPGFDLNFWFSMQVPAATPSAVIDRLGTALLEVTSQDSFAEALRLRGAEPLVVPRSELKDFVLRECGRWTRVAREINLTAQ